MAFVCLAACEGGGSAAPNAVREAPDDRDDERDAGHVADGAASPDAGDNPLLGVWTNEVGEDCSYLHQFDEEGVYRSIASSGEIVVADYEIAAPDEAGGRFMLSFTIVSDNNGVDCEGEQNDEVGQAHSAYVEPVSDDVVRIYRAEYGTTSSRWTRQ